LRVLVGRLHIFCLEYFLPVTAIYPPPGSDDGEGGDHNRHSIFLFDHSNGSGRQRTPVQLQLFQGGFLGGPLHLY
jgi:hypothetical protein